MSDEAGPPVPWTAPKATVQVCSEAIWRGKHTAWLGGGRELTYQVVCVG